MNEYCLFQTHKIGTSVKDSVSFVTQNYGKEDSTFKTIILASLCQSQTCVGVTHVVGYMHDANLRVRLIFYPLGNECQPPMEISMPQ